MRSMFAIDGRQIVVSEQAPLRCHHPEAKEMTLGDGVSTVMFCSDCGTNFDVRTPFTEEKA